MWWTAENGFCESGEGNLLVEEGLVFAEKIILGNVTGEDIVCS